MLPPAGEGWRGMGCRTEGSHLPTSILALDSLRSTQRGSLVYGGGGARGPGWQVCPTPLTQVLQGLSSLTKAAVGVSEELRTLQESR